MIKNCYHWSKMVQYGFNITQNMKMAKLVQNNLGQTISYSNIFKCFGQIYFSAKIFVNFSRAICSDIHL